MFRAMILSLFGGVFEVRLINLKSGKDIPGTRLYKGSFWKCRKVFLNKKLKYGELKRLQAVTVLDHDINSTKEMIDPVEQVVKIPEDMVTRIEGTFPLTGIPEGAEMIIIDEASDVDPGIYESNARQSDFMAKTQDEPNEYQGEDLDDHTCDVNGPQDWDTDTDTYRPTCSICSAFQKLEPLENI